ncbi:TIGR00282 family metallophosphoesterase [Mycoplasma bradburyae]|uniref:TIGR00282 family metallophosphoesterase n=1 Tax=Mycoplasma bradburyae TaxID=2963128 RepID=A0AAW6HRW3_9MOLU|nr:TIGR00282 family metallophosphoesterase [Mycoplasma bradburyae]MDC4183438.1 TIGR00282 family metallophosphoesterase [Mycoplasma bradburyae]UTS71209.1 TIGR00282 family metallophosphoesterase [Mycoplasma bradburyae]
MKILFLGDIFGVNGRNIIKKHLCNLRVEHNVDLVIANAENCTHGKGLSKQHYVELMSYGIDFFTMGNHTWAKKEILDILRNKQNIIRPLNLDKSFQYWNDGLGTSVIKYKNKKIRVTNMLGEGVKLNFKLTNPFYVLKDLVKNTNEDLHIVDFHAETTSEKNALAVYFDGQVSAILGTHTHVPTADLRLTPKGMIYVTDVGMCGPGFGSIIGAKAQNVLTKFFYPDQRFNLEVSKLGAQLNAILMEFDDRTNKGISTKRIQILEDDVENYLKEDFSTI